MEAPVASSLLEERRSAALHRLDALRATLTDAPSLLSGKGCAYLTGSFGRLEAGRHSDLDLFIVARTAEENRSRKRLLSPIDETLVKADLIRAARQLAFPEFDRDGQFLTPHADIDLVATLGKPDDDAVNTFTARLLLLLESRPLLENDIYDQIRDEVIDAYWRDYPKHQHDFRPVFLLNDILRLWRTFCVNYEAQTQSDPPREAAKRRLKHYKLEHSRLLTCYSGIAFLLDVYRTHRTVAPEAVRSMVETAPTARLEMLRDGHPTADTRDAAHRSLELYAGFLEKTDRSKDDLIEIFSDADKRRKFRGEEGAFGRAMFELVRGIDLGGELFRFLVV